MCHNIVHSYTERFVHFYAKASGLGDNNEAANTYINRAARHECRAAHYPEIKVDYFLALYFSRPFLRNF